MSGNREGRANETCCHWLKVRLVRSKLLKIVLGGTAASHTSSVLGGGHFLIKNSWGNSRPSHPVLNRTEKPHRGHPARARLCSGAKDADGDSRHEPRCSRPLWRPFSVSDPAL